jgi:hypothetical protein
MLKANQNATGNQVDRFMIPQPFACESILPESEMAIIG